MKKLFLIPLIVTIISCQKKESDPIAATPIAQPSIGAKMYGGVIFYIDNTGNHGLVSSSADINHVVAWYNGSYILTSAIGSSIGTGKSNTDSIISKQGNTITCAAVYCDNLILEGYSDWFMPSTDELAKLYLQKETVGGFTSVNYWTSTEVDINKARMIDFGTGLPSDETKSYGHRIRPIRSF